VADTRVTVIIPNYNGKGHLERLLPSIADQTWRDYEVVVIDDFSPDMAAVEHIKMFVKDHKNMRLVQNEANLGFVRNCNKGFRLATSDYLCILTNDTKVERNFIERNVQILDADNSIGILSCIIVDQHGDTWFSGGLFRAGVRTNLQDDFEGIRAVDWVAGTACFYRREVLDRVGLLDESLVMYHEDIDLCLRVKSQTHYRACMFSEKLVTHYLENLDHIPTAKQERQFYYLHRNHILLLKRYSRRHIPKVLVLDIKELAVLLGAAVVAVLRPRPTPPSRLIRLAILTMRGIWDGLAQKAK
jgi:GT2 family glycosyltransferase